MYKVVFKKSISKDLRKIDKKSLQRIFNKLEKDLPMQADTCKELKGNFKGLRRYRIGDYRVIFSIIETELWILHIQHRKDVYNA